MYDYTDEQYEKYFKSDTWFAVDLKLHHLKETELTSLYCINYRTKEETDRLYSLCRQYDLRFFVIYDKWPDDGRTIEVR